MTLRLLGITALFVATLLEASASPKIALVRVRDIYVDQPAIKAALEKANKAKEAVLLDPRAEELRVGIDTLRDLQKKISDPNNPPTNEEGRKLAREFEIKRLETNTLQEDFERFRVEREQEINTEMVNEIRAVLNQIMAFSQRMAQEKGYDIVIDSTGSTNSNVPFLLYAKDSTDLTDDVIAAFKAEEDASNQTSETNPEPAPSTTPEEGTSEP